jgi:hypothetical protein
LRKNAARNFHNYLFGQNAKAFQEILAHRRTLVDLFVQIGTFGVHAHALQEKFARWHLGQADFVRQQTIFLQTLTLQESAFRRATLAKKTTLLQYLDSPLANGNLFGVVYFWTTAASERQAFSQSSVNWTRLIVFDQISRQHGDRALLGGAEMRQKFDRRTVLQSRNGQKLLTSNDF